MQETAMSCMDVYKCLDTDVFCGHICQKLAQKDQTNCPFVLPTPHVVSLVMKRANVIPIYTFANIQYFYVIV